MYAFWHQPGSMSSSIPPSVSVQALLERLGGVPEEWRQAQSAGASRRRWSLDVRYRMHVSHNGKEVRCAGGGGC